MRASESERAGAIMDQGLVPVANLIANANEPSGASCMSSSTIGQRGRRWITSACCMMACVCVGDWFWLGWVGWVLGQGQATTSAGKHNKLRTQFPIGCMSRSWRDGVGHDFHSPFWLVLHACLLLPSNSRFLSATCAVLESAAARAFWFFHTVGCRFRTTFWVFLQHVW